MGREMLTMAERQLSERGGQGRVGKGSAMQERWGGAGKQRRESSSSKCALCAASMLTLCTFSDPLSPTEKRRPRHVVDDKSPERTSLSAAHGDGHSGSKAGES